MDRFEEVKGRILFQFCNLRKALIDASSIIYMDEGGFLAKVARAVELHAPEEILEETGLKAVPVGPIPATGEKIANDQKLIDRAISKQLPVISEDRKILQALDREKIPYLNALMMLNFLLFKGDISFEQHGAFFQRLTGCSWYSDRVLAFSKKVYGCIVAGSNRFLKE
jgi:hypothetical protein